MTKCIKVVLRLSEQEKADLDLCSAKEGKGMSEFIRGLITAKKQKMFPYYKVKTGKVINAEPEKPKLTKEQICVMRGGKVLKQGNKMFCDFTRYNKTLKIDSGYSVSLDSLEEDDD